MGSDEDSGQTVKIDLKMRDTLIMSQMGFGGELPIVSFSMSSAKDLSDIRVRFVSEPPNLMGQNSFRWSFLLKDKKKTLAASDLLGNISFSRDYLSALTEPSDCTVRAEVVKGKEVLGASPERKIRVYPERWWRWTPEYPFSVCTFIDGNDLDVLGRHPDISKSAVKAGVAQPFRNYIDNGPEGIAKIVTSAVGAARTLSLRKRPSASSGSGFNIFGSFRNMAISHSASSAEAGVYLISLLTSMGLNVDAATDGESMVVAVWLTGERQACPDLDAMIAHRDAGHVMLLHSDCIFADAGEDPGEAAEKALKEYGMKGAKACIDINADMRDRMSMLHAGETEDEEDAYGFITGKMDVWMTKLLDLSKNNLLVDFKGTSRVVPLMVPDIQTFFDDLVGGCDVELVPSKEGLTVDRSEDFFSDWGIESGDSPLRAQLEGVYSRGQKKRSAPVPIDRAAERLNSLYDEKKKTIKDTGANPVYVAFDTVQWDDGGTVRYAPFILIRVDMIDLLEGENEANDDAPSKKRVRKLVISKDANADVMLNSTFVQRMVKDRKPYFSLDGFLDENGGLESLTPVREAFTKLINGFSGWEVRHTVSIGSFSFSNYVLWNDLKTHSEKIRQNKIVGSLIENQNKLGSDTIRMQETFDDVRTFVNADGSQMAAIDAAVRGQSFVIHGPPGTGKSETITNIIANLMLRGKKVLFVAEKPTALDVVYGKLKGLGLESFIMRLDARTAVNQHDILVRLNDTAVALENDDSVWDPKHEEDVERSYRNDERYFTDFRKLMYGPAYFGKSYRELINEYTGMRDIEEGSGVDGSYLDYYRYDFMDRLEQLLKGMSIDLGTVNFSKFPLPECRLTRIEADSLERIDRMSDSFVEQMDELERDGIIWLAWADEEERETILSHTSRLKSGLTVSEKEPLELFGGVAGYLGGDKLDFSTEERELDSALRSVDAVLGAYTPDNSSLRERILAQKEFLAEVAERMEDRPARAMNTEAYGPEEKDTLGFWKGLSEGFDSTWMRRTRVHGNSPVSVTYCMSEIKALCNHFSELGIRDDCLLNGETSRTLGRIRLRSVPPEGWDMDTAISRLGHVPLMLTDPVSDPFISRLNEYISELETLDRVLFFPDHVRTFIEDAKRIASVKQRILDLSEYDTSDMAVNRVGGIRKAADAYFGEKCGTDFQTYLKRCMSRAVSDSSTDGLARELREALEPAKRKRSEVVAKRIPDDILNSPDLGKLTGTVAERSMETDYNGINEMRGRVLDGLVALSGMVTKDRAVSIGMKETDEILTALENLDAGGDPEIGRVLAPLDPLRKDAMEIMGKSGAKGDRRSAGWKDVWDPSLLTCGDEEFNSIRTGLAAVQQAGFRSSKAAKAGFMEKFGHLCPGASFDRAADTFPGIAKTRFLLDKFRSNVRYRYAGQVEYAMTQCRWVIERDSATIGQLSRYDSRTLKLITDNADALVSYADAVSDVRGRTGELLGMSMSDCRTDVLLAVADDVASAFRDSDSSGSRFASIEAAIKDLTALRIGEDSIRQFQTYLSEISATNRMLRELGAYGSPSMMSEIMEGRLQRDFARAVGRIEEQRSLFAQLELSFEESKAQVENDYLDQKKELHASAREFDEEIMKLKSVLDILKRRGYTDCSTYRSLKPRIERFNQTIKDLYTSLDLDVEQRGHITDMDSCRKFRSDVKGCGELILQWVTLKGYEKKMGLAGFKWVYDRIYNKETRQIRCSQEDLELFSAQFKKAIYHLAIKAYQNKHKELRPFNKGEFEANMGIYARRDRELHNINTDRLRRALIDAVTGIRDSPELIRLNNLVNGETLSYKPKGQENVSYPPLRKIFRDNLPTTLTTLAPCIMMSPSAVAECLEMDTFSFDYLLFDEASQIFTHKAVGALARAENAIIVGDPKQLPPPSLFEAKISQELLDKVGDIAKNSVLDECININLPDTRLTCHYRSAHESLISFSNSMIYLNTMSTFPSVDSRISRLSFVHVENGYIDDGDDRTGDKRADKGNVPEAKRLVAYLLEKLTSGDGPVDFGSSSIGIITFSLTQKTAVEREIEALEETDPEGYGRIRSKLDSRDPSRRIEIRNLENVQGEEYDIVLFSVAHGFHKRIDANGNEINELVMRFGAINENEGWRRLNVAITRSRQLMVVFSSIRYSDFGKKLDKYPKESGVHRLADFLDYAETGSIRLDDQKSGASGRTNDNIVEQLRDELAENGLECDINVGRSKFKVDLAIIDPDDPDRYIMGILTDGSCFRDTVNVRDRTFAQADVLKSRGWRIVYVWSAHWLMNRRSIVLDITKQIESIRSARKN